jgi:hypothetical protein
MQIKEVLASENGAKVLANTVVFCGISDGFDIQQDNVLREDGDS